MCNRRIPKRLAARAGALALAGVALSPLAAGQGVPAAAVADSRGGKLLLTGGVTSIDGAAGGGLTPWAVIGGYGSRGQWGATAALTRVETQDYGLDIAGLALGLDDRLELSLAQQRFDTRDTGVALGLPGLQLRQDIVGVKARIAGEAILDSDRWMPQISIGAQWKRLSAGGLKPTLDSLGASSQGLDYYVSATKLILSQGLLLNGTLRATQANQNGLLGFGATDRNRYRILPEISVALLLNRQVAVGLEYRMKPDNLNPSSLGEGLKEDDWSDVFVAWAPSKYFSLTAAYVRLGGIVPAVAPRRQSGGYLSAQIAY